MPISLRARGGTLLAHNTAADELRKPMDGVERENKQFPSFETTRCA